MVSGGEVVLCLESVCLLLPTASCKLQRLLGIAGLQMSSGKEERFSAILTYNLIDIIAICTRSPLTVSTQLLRSVIQL